MFGGLGPQSPFTEFAPQNTLLVRSLGKCMPQKQWSARWNRVHQMLNVKIKKSHNLLVPNPPFSGSGCIYIFGKVLGRVNDTAVNCRKLL